MSTQKVWAKEALKRMEEQRKSEMPGMLVAKQKATQNARDGKADRAAQHKEARQLREAEEVRNVQESLQILSLDPQWSAAAQHGAPMEHWWRRLAPVHARWASGSSVTTVKVLSSW